MAIHISDLQVPGSDLEGRSTSPDLPVSNGVWLQLCEYSGWAIHVAGYRPVHIDTNGLINALHAMRGIGRHSQHTPERLDGPVPKLDGCAVQVLQSGWIKAFLTFPAEIREILVSPGPISQFGVPVQPPAWSANYSHDSFLKRWENILTRVVVNKEAETAPIVYGLNAEIPARTWTGLLNPKYLPSGFSSLSFMVSDGHQHNHRWMGGNQSPHGVPCWGTMDLFTRENAGPLDLREVDKGFFSSPFNHDYQSDWVWRDYTPDPSLTAIPASQLISTDSINSRNE